VVLAARTVVAASGALPSPQAHTDIASVAYQPSFLAENTLHPTVEEGNQVVRRTSVADLVEAGLVGSGRFAVAE
jgi:hypothetical protein